MTRPAPLLATSGLATVASAGALRALQWAGERIDRPRALSRAAIESWYQSAAPASAAATVAWAAAAVLTTWLLVATLLQVAAAAAGGQVLRSVADAISPRSLQRFGRGLAGLSLTAGLAAAPGAGLSAGLLQERFEEVGVVAEEGQDERPPVTAVEPGTATMTRLDPHDEPPTTPPAPTTVPPTTTTAATSSADPSPPTRPSTTSVPSGPPPSAPAGTTLDAGAAPAPPAGGGDPELDLPSAPPAEPVVLDPGPSEPFPPSTSSGHGGASVVVAPGMSFWSIAEEVMADQGGALDERALHRYWQALIAANRERLVVPGNPDLLLPGQQLVLPAT